ncbi:Gfo/Idh/MocA family protein [Xanthomonas arboricola]|uniref:Inositol 2-dehydrogenase/D-chiro-inositol 3-dehydrogenase n=1 Tax=Xanthomonas arboricola pv. corylina TaxID=487821 RepID=A0ABM8RZC4_9XANT|nr:Gfo/Idh/MocA family oxidoreductase [Xanthomonas arboricola]MDN0209257.1 Gfo/Idh/MocA family oxidoreductase [Xanthomonas arboricola pv. corylina]MDN0213658.1 Gfo/Idh/MocA family oxidoreductase [Xanthomonas arboricola pv. corylina]QUI82627.1 Gfo/Idh/MocA family oxidoreductase [Xanthomonas arboricola pv. corylina]UQQ12706.1 Gfo/Idh/MocA family oxidoreductase [Xanthomonas arboricola pv. corylina]CAE6780198.1 Inositol 2-dehydrogenase/D-chiro-inositol 3-dehydrogenase [Xanthomonas arboricola pv. c
MKDKIRVGIVGVTPGRSWATVTHIPALQALPDYEIVAVANSHQASSEKAAKEFGIPKAFPSAAALAHDPDVDVVAVTVKVPFHKELVNAALDGKKQIYCEWPLGNGLVEAEAMAGRARELGIATAVGLQARSSPTIRYVRDLIRDGYVGKVLSSTLVGSAISNGATAPESLAYMFDQKNGASSFTIAFGHAIDALCWVLGEFREIDATLQTRCPTFIVEETKEVRPNDTHDQIVVGGVLENGTVVSAHYRGGLSRGTNLLWEINGTEGDLRITAPHGHLQMAELTLHGGRDDDSALSVMEIPAKYRTVPAELAGPAVAVAEAYARFAKGADTVEPPPDFDEAVKRHRLLDAIERSAATGTRIKL